ncbi:molybdopterin-dependent oxidoreductase [Nocardioides sp. GY 10127]|uniref:molybdopterin-dependent oxidoreductase n=1 Tax=Nocardioides sp. GY 10127 TaxID=2569762 RepID=UPI0010A77D63|nr:molybdopterin-dependent oxidoreductase [Nocardioides sp. GY 10127]TIC84049.1 hypothetical protein E8D37_04375 [Nocardioides sp. GY 10127]
MAHVLLSSRPHAGATRARSRATVLPHRVLRRAARLLATVITALASIALAGSLTACGTQEDATSEADPYAPTGATLHPGDEVPAPTGKVLLTVTGGTVTNVGDELQLDRDLLDALGTVSYEVDDDQATGEVATFSGPLVSDVLAVAGVPDDAETMHTVALNDYSVDVPVSDAEELPLILATLMDGEPMTVARYGPTRFVYPTEGFDLDTATYNPRWIWQLASIDVE